MKKLFQVLTFLSVLAAWSLPAAEEVKKIEIEELKAMLSEPSLVVLDVRSDKDWAGSESKIKGAVREDPGKVKAWMDKYGKDKTLVFYCA